MKRQDDRFTLSLSGMMFAIAVIAMSLGALLNPTGPWAFAVSEATLLILLLALPTCMARSGRPRAFWLGFCSFGWAHFIVGSVPWFSEIYGSALRESLAAAGVKIFPDDIAFNEFDDLGPKVTNFVRVARSILVLACAYAGGLIADFVLSGKGNDPVTSSMLAVPQHA